LKTNIITLAHQKGGTGKSTIAWNIAIELVNKYKSYGFKKFIFADLDNQESISMTNRLRMQYNKKPLEIIRFTDDERSKLEEFINSIEDDTLVLIDSGGYDADLNRLAIVASDFIITPVSSDYMEIFGLQKFKTILEELSVIKNEMVHVHVLLNKIDPKLKNFSDIKDFINDIANFKLLKTVIRFRSDYKHSIGYGLSVKELDKKSKASNEIDSLIKEIEKKIGYKNGKKKK